MMEIATRVPNHDLIEDVEETTNIISKRDRVKPGEI